MLIQAAVSGHLVYFCPRHRVVFGIHPNKLQSGINFRSANRGDAWYAGQGHRVSYCRQSQWSTCFGRGKNDIYRIFPFSKETDIGATFGAALALTDKKGWRKGKQR